jgi:hypothetical protein
MIDMEKNRAEEQVFNGPPAEQQGAAGAPAIRRPRWHIRAFARGGVQVTLACSALIFAMYMIGNIPDPGFPDWFMFLLLRVLRYSSLLLCAFSLCALGLSVHQIVEHPRLRTVLGIVFYFSTGILGVILAMLNSFIVVATRGNG